ncbi:glycosyltransferase family 2 protein [Phascolarctobacterium faecium]|uniref:glycosyltransferase family 2 protein n=1 Tax=Phascolarctobacterium faecium TaxID=33025 RepID=UPI003AF126A9
MQNRCAVTVVIPCYNSGATIERAIKSVVSQTLLPKEIIIVDDCSSDIGMKAVLEVIKDRYAHLVDIKLIYAGENGGAGTARNIGCSEAKCEYIAFLDSDDVWHPDKLKIQFNYMNNHRDVYFTCHHMQIIGDNDSAFFRKNVSITEKDIISINPVRYLFKHYPRGGTPSIMVKKTDLKFDSGKRYSEDYLLWLEYCFHYKGVLLDAELAAAYKAIYGAGGLSANLWKIEKGEIETYSILKKKGIIGCPIYIGACVFSLVKFLRRWLICRLR